MRLAIIDYKKDSNRLIEYLQGRDVEVHISEAREEFENRYGSLGNYDGLLLHPSVRNWTSYLRDIPNKYPELKYAIGCHGLSDYFEDGKISVFDFSDSEGIFQYFFCEKENIKEDLKTLFI